jgi:hypothetical protein
VEDLRGTRERPLASYSDQVLEALGGDHGSMVCRTALGLEPNGVGEPGTSA